MNNPTSDITFIITGEPVTSGETWVLIESPTWSYGTFFSDINFTAGGITWTGVGAGGYHYKCLQVSNQDQDRYICDTSGSWYDLDLNITTYAESPLKSWTFSTAPTGDLLTWLQSNATKQ